MTARTPTGPGLAGPAADNPPISVPLPPWLMWRAVRELERAGIPFQQNADGTITTLEAAAPILDMIQAQGGAGGGISGLDLLRRRPVNRRRLTDAIGYVLSLALVLGILVQSGGWASKLGLGSIGRGGLVLVAGFVVTLFVSEIVIGRGDRRRWMFVLGMMGLFLAGAMWFIGKGTGVF